MKDDKETATSATPDEKGLEGPANTGDRDPEEAAPPVPTADSKPEFKEGGYGWYVLLTPKDRRLSP
jgi:hypothetical protein